MAGEYHGGAGHGPSGRVPVVGDRACFPAGPLGLHILDVSGPARTASLRINRAGGLPLLQLDGAVGGNFVVEYAPALPVTGDWPPLATVTLTNRSQTIVDTTLGAASNRFYRARLR